MSNSSLVPPWEELPEADTAGLPPPICGSFDRDVNDTLVLKWENDAGKVFVVKTDGFLVGNGRANAPWLPAGWTMDVFPCGWSRGHLEHWFDYALVAAREDDRRGDIPRRPDGQPAAHANTKFFPRAKESVRNAYLIITHLGITDRPPSDTGKPDPDRLQDLKEFVLSRVSVPGDVGHNGSEHQSDEREPAPSAAATSRAKKQKRSTAKGEAREKIISALSKHHGYDKGGGCLCTEPIGVNELARRSKVASSSVSDFFKKQFGGHAQYRITCHKGASNIAANIKLMRGEYTPRHARGYREPSENEHDRE